MTKLRPSLWSPCPESSLALWLPGGVGWEQAERLKRVGIYAYICIYVSVSQFSLSVLSNSLQPHGMQHTRLSCPSPTPWSLLKLMSIESVMPSNHLILCRPLLLLPSIFPSIRVFSNKSVLCIRWPKCWSFSFGISPSSEYSGLISFRIDWFGQSIIYV